MTVRKNFFQEEKSIVNENYLLVVQNLIERNKNRLDTKRSPKQQEKDELFFWIMSRLEWSMQNCHPAKKSHIVKIESHLKENGTVSLTHGHVSEYISQYVHGEDFFSIVEEVSDVFNEISTSKENRYHFSSVFFHSTIEKDFELIVHMATLV